MDMTSIGDAELATWSHGDGPPVLLVSGLGGRAVFWDPVVPALSRTFRLITHDHRGTGASTKSIMTYSVAQMAGDVLALMDALGIEKAHMVGHSTGGAITQHIALHHPERLDKIVLSATWPGPHPYFQEYFRLRRDVLTKIGPEAYLTDGTLKVLSPAALSEDPDLLTRTVADRLASFPGEEIEASRIDAVLAHDLRDKVPDIAHKSLVICAADDEVTPLFFSEELVSLINRASLHKFDTGGHFFPHAHPKYYAAAVTGFLEGDN